LTATVEDSAGASASAASTVTATTQPTTDTILLNLSESNRDGDAAFTVAVNGQQVGGTYTAHALNASGDAGTVSLTGNWGSGVNDVQVSFINQAWGRDLYVNSIAENGVTYAGTSGALLTAGSSETFDVGATTPKAAAPADTLTLDLSEDAWKGNALFDIYVDGKRVTSPQVVSALHDASQTQSFTLTGNWGAGTHTIGVSCVNHAYGGAPSEARDVYIDGATLNGSAVFGGSNTPVMSGVGAFTVVTTH
jgi:hypothetical protein